MSLREILESNADISLKDGLYFHRTGSTDSSFEELYLALRAKEGRVYPDDVVAMLPEIAEDHPLKKEWIIRKESSGQLITYLAKLNPLPARILEVGCGNGWLSRRLAGKIHCEVCGVDVNEFELSQAARLSISDRLTFVHGNVMESLFPDDTFDIILLASSIQYFPDLNALIRRLLRLLNQSGEIHILDSPLYVSRQESEKARSKSLHYFSQMGFPAMDANYFHHTLGDLAGTTFTVIRDPKSWPSFLKRALTGNPSPFPWIKIVKAG